jgi:hypothetical protein
MDDTLRHDIPQVSEEDNEVFVAPLSGEEVKMQSSIWNITRHLVRMAFQLNFTNFLGSGEAGFDEPLL